MRMTTGKRHSNVAVRIAVAALLVVPASVATLSLAPASTAAPSKQDVLQAKAELDRLNEHVSLLVEQYNQARIRLDSIRQRLADAQAAADRAQNDADRAVASLNANAAIAYQGVGSQFAALLEADSISDFSDRLEFMGSMAQADSDLANEAARAQQEAHWTAAELHKVVDEQQQVVSELASKKAEIQSAASQAEAYYNDLSRKYQAHLDALQAAAEAQAAASVAAESGSPAPSGGSIPAPPAPNGNVQAVLDAAYSVIGTPYQWGGASPETGFDCSGFTMWAWAHAGVSLPHSSAAQYASLPHVDRSNLQPGDLLFFYSPISHVAIYVGGNSMIHSPHTGSSVQVVPVYWDSFTGAARPV